MSIESNFERVKDSGWRLGFDNLFARENRKWWSSNRWWVQSLIWVLFLVGFVFMALYIIPSLTTPEGAAVVDQDPVSGALQGFFGIGSLLLAIGITILMQDELIAEKQSGTAEWVLSKPVSRTAFLVAKLAAHTIGMFIVMIAVPGVLAYGLLSFFVGYAYPLASYLAGVGVLALHTFFYLTLVLMLGVLVNRREILLAVALFSLLGGSFIRNFIPQPSLFTPWYLSDVGGIIAMGLPLTADLFIPIYATAAWSILFIVVAVLRFRQYEF